MFYPMVSSHDGQFFNLAKLMKRLESLGLMINGMINPQPILLGLAPGEPSRVSQAMHSTHNIMDRGETIP
jgi:hypothetical protein